MSSSYPGPAIVLGHSGFVGRALSAALESEGASVHGFSSKELDLRNPAAFEVLEPLVGPDTTLFVCAALTPDRGGSIDTCLDHITMTANLARHLAEQVLRKCVFVSSDAVYPMVEAPVTEDTCVDATGAYPLAKYASERLLQMALAGKNTPLLIVRPTAVFGPGDTHNSYGPNRFVGTAVADRTVRLFGHGEELRDHLYIDDLARILIQLGAGSEMGLLNIATGSSITFGSIVDALGTIVPEPFEVVNAPRAGSPTHRSFDIRRLAAAVPNLEFTPFEDALRTTVAAASAGARV